MCRKYVLRTFQRGGVRVCTYLDLHEHHERFRRNPDQISISAVLGTKYPRLYDIQPF